MTVPTARTDLSATAGSNSPSGSEAVFPNLDNYLRAAFAFIKQNYDDILQAQTDIDSAVPAGIITMWSGASAEIPAGWTLCDGSNGTPDLRDRFVIGATSTYAVGASGGATSAVSDSQGSHDHGAATGSHVLTTTEIPSHTHALSTLGKAQADGNTTSSDGGMVSYNVGSSGAIANSTAAAGSGSGHTHTITSGGAHTHTTATLPPYYALCYVMKT